MQVEGVSGQIGGVSEQVEVYSEQNDPPTVRVEVSIRQCGLSTVSLDSKIMLQA